MLFLYPVGHDQEVYTQPYLTWGFIIICVIVQLWSSSVEAEREAAVIGTSIAADQYFTRGPSKRVSWELYQGLLPSQRHIVEPFVAKDEEEDERIDETMEARLLDLLDSIERLPARQLGYVPVDGGARRVFTSMVAHAGWIHLLGNLFILMLAGAVLECFWRRWAYGAMAVAAGLAGVAAFHLADPSGVIPIIGASGIVAGIMGAFLVGFANTEIRLGWMLWLFAYARFGVIKVPAMVLIPLWIGFQLYDFAAAGDDGVAYSAHIGGFFAGVALALLARQFNLVASDAGHSRA